MYINKNYKVRYKLATRLVVSIQDLYQPEKINLIIIISQTRNKIGGLMDTQNLLTTLSHVFNNSTPAESEQLFKRIKELALKKILVNRENSDGHKGKSQLKPIKRRMIMGRRDKGRKCKFITRQKLKQSAIRKISRENKRLHQNHFSHKHLQSFKLAQAQPVAKGYSFQLHSDNEEQKLQSHQSSFEAKCLAIPSTRGNFQTNTVSLKRSHPETCPKIHTQTKFKKTRKNFKTYLQSKQTQSKIDQLACPICIETLIDPVSTICGHSFCHRCLDESLLFAPTCPVCRLHIKGQQLVLCQYLQQLIRIKCNQFLEDKEALEVYKMRKEQNEEWKKARIIDPNEVKQGMVLDVRDTESIWCQARVEKVYFVGLRVNSVLVHYLQWAKLYDEIIDIKSSRLAPQGHFSSRTDIPRYNLTQQEQNLRGAVITGENNQRQNPFLQPPRQINFQRIFQLNNRLNTINTINMFSRNFSQRLSQEENVFIPIAGRQLNIVLNDDNVFHPEDDSDDDSIPDEYDRVSWRERNDQEPSQFQFQEQQEIIPDNGLQFLYRPEIFIQDSDEGEAQLSEANLQRLFGNNQQGSIVHEPHEQPPYSQSQSSEQQQQPLQQLNNSQSSRRINLYNSLWYGQQDQSGHMMQEDNQQDNIDCENHWRDDVSYSDE